MKFDSLYKDAGPEKGPIFFIYAYTDPDAHKSIRAKITPYIKKLFLFTDGDGDGDVKSGFETLFVDTGEAGEIGGVEKVEALRETIASLISDSFQPAPSKSTLIVSSDTPFSFEVLMKETSSGVIIIMHNYINKREAKANLLVL